MKPKQADILRHASTLFNREGYQSPSIERMLNMLASPK
ncbi:Uncharacterised protein [Klebsiella pneumoniae]|nr:Uncharacterised protein [Klebsiella pneumoniae]